MLAFTYTQTRSKTQSIFIVYIMQLAKGINKVPTVLKAALLEMACEVTEVTAAG